MHGVEVAAGGVFPPADPLRGCGVGGVALEVLGCGIEIRIACHVLALSIDEELVDFQVLWGASLPECGGDLFPVQVEFVSAADYGPIMLGGAEYDGEGFGSGVLGLEH
ncbi:MAG: hypothetical protein RI897_3322 [Verrucomicrobiota bacterium]